MNVFSVKMISSMSRKLLVALAGVATCCPHIVAQESATTKFDPEYIDEPLRFWHTIIAPAAGAILLLVVWKFLRWQISREHGASSLRYWFPTLMIVIGSALVWAEGTSVLPLDSTLHLVASFLVVALSVLNFPAVAAIVVATEHLPRMPLWTLVGAAEILVWGMWHLIIRFLELQESRSRASPSSLPSS